MTQSLSIVSPKTGEHLQDVPLMDRESILATFAVSQKVFESWRETPLRQRVALLKKLRTIVVEQADEIAQTISNEQGKSVCEALATEIVTALDMIKFLEQNGTRLLRSFPVQHGQLLFAHKHGQIRYEPYGVIAIISPWNFPFSIPLLAILQAIFVGNSVVLKPSPFTPLSGLKIAELLMQAGFPDRLVQTVVCEDAVAPVMCDNPFTRKVIFTGSGVTGQKVMQAAAKRIIPVILELGGKDAAIVTHHAHLPKAAAGIAWGSCMNAGQACASVERVYVEQEVYHKFLDLLRAEWAKITIAPMIHTRQKQIVEQHLADALAKGAKLLCGGKAGTNPQLAYLEPTLLADCNHEMIAMREETFGPVCCVMPVGSLTQAIELANDSNYGLTASLWSENRQEQELFAAKIMVASATINDCIYSFGEANAPWGGFKASGIGRTHSQFGLREMVQPKFVSVDHTRRPNLWWFPYDDAFTEFIRHAIIGLYHANFKMKLRHTLQLLKFPRFWKTARLWGMIKGIGRWF